MISRALLVINLVSVFLSGCDCAGPAGPTGAAGQPCSVKDNGDGTATLTCPDGTAITLATGPGGDAGADRSCTALDNGDGTATITCPDGSVVTVPLVAVGEDAGPADAGPQDGALSEDVTVSDAVAVDVVPGLDVRDEDRGPIDRAPAPDAAVDTGPTDAWFDADLEVGSDASMDAGSDTGFDAGGPPCRALQFDGVSSKVVVPDAPALRLVGTPYTLEAWVYVADYTDQVNTAILARRIASEGIKFLVDGRHGGDRPGGTLVHWTNPDGAQNVGSDDPVPVQQWVHVAATHDPVAQTSVVWIDGVLQGSGPQLPFGDVASDLHIGADIIGAHWDGMIAEVRISDTIRYTEPFTPTVGMASDENTVALWRLDGAHGETVPDLSGNGHDGTIQGAVAVDSSHCGD